MVKPAIQSKTFLEVTTYATVSQLQSVKLIAHHLKHRLLAPSWLEFAIFESLYGHVKVVDGIGGNINLEAYANFRDLHRASVANEMSTAIACGQRTIHCFLVLDAIQGWHVTPQDKRHRVINRIILASGIIASPHVVHIENYTSWNMFDHGTLKPCTRNIPYFTCG